MSLSIEDVVKYFTNDEYMIQDRKEGGGQAILIMNFTKILDLVPYVGQKIFTKLENLGVKNAHSWQSIIYGKHLQSVVMYDWSGNSRITRN